VLMPIVGKRFNNEYANMLKILQEWLHLKSFHPSTTTACLKQHELSAGTFNCA
jgi:hypothetical protein